MLDDVRTEESKGAIAEQLKGPKGAWWIEDPLARMRERVVIAVYFVENGSESWLKAVIRNLRPRGVQSGARCPLVGYLLRYSD